MASFLPHGGGVLTWEIPHFLEGGMWVMATTAASMAAPWSPPPMEHQEIQLQVHIERLFPLLWGREMPFVDTEVIHLWGGHRRVPASTF